MKRALFPIFLLLFPLDIAQADEPPSLGDRGTIAISGDFWLDAGYTFPAAGWTTGTSVSISPSVDLFLWRRVSVGMNLTLSFSAWDGTTFWTANIAPRLGYVVPLGDRISLWPQVQLGLELSVSDFAALSDLPAETDTEIELDLQANLPLVFEPVPHVFLGAGPYIARTLFWNENPTGNNPVSIGILSTLGGYF